VGSMGVIGVDGTNGAVKLLRGRISKGYTTRYGGFYVEVKLLFQNWGMSQHVFALIRNGA
jgi:hypothetical protein